uniref:Phosphorylated adapter RNA export protein n=1 Tax=Gongylonema pulchrum TaxID=637853 RepID=A0A183DJD6_9BILA
LEYNYSVIHEIGREKALELFDETREIEVTGGMMVADGTRRRTPGGVFMTLFKTDPDVLPVLKEKVCNLQKAANREIRKARRKKFGMGGALKKVICYSLLTEGQFLTSVYLIQIFFAKIIRFKCLKCFDLNPSYVLSSLFIEPLNLVLMDKASDH